MPGIRQRTQHQQELDESSIACPCSSSFQSVKRQAVEQRCSAEGDQPLDALLRRKWFGGRLMSNEVQEIAVASVGQGASVGKLGRPSSAKNAFRDVKSALGYPAEAPALDFIEVPGITNLPICCPIRYFEALVSGKPDRCRKVLIGPPSANVRFWRRLSGHPSCPLEWDNRTLALGMHGDGAATFNTEGLFSIAWNSLHGEGNTSETRFVFATIKKSDIVRGTLHAVFERFAWAMNALSAGEMPQFDWKGQPCKDAGRKLAQGWKGSLVQCRGDWEFYQQVLKFPAHSSEPYMCWLCRASPSGRLCWANFRDDAAWKATMETHATYLERLAAQGLEPSILFRVKTLKLEGVMIDVLHTVDQGLATHLIANVLVEVCDKLPGPTQESRAKRLNAMLQAWYTRNRDRYRIDCKLEWSRLKTSGDWPKLRAKAAATRHLAAWALELATEYCGDSEHDQWRRGCCQLLNRFYEILASQPQFLSTEAKTELGEVGPLLLQLYSKLSGEALEHNRRMWKMAPKFHLFQHLCQTSFLNPRFCWTYGDEDLQKHLKCVARSSHASTVSYTTVYKWVSFVFC